MAFPYYCLIELLGLAKAVEELTAVKLSVEIVDFLNRQFLMFLNGFPQDLSHTKFQTLPHFTI